MSVGGEVLAYLKVVAWPVTVVVVLVLFREAIRKVLGGLEEFDGFGIKARIRQQVADGIASAQDALDASPIGLTPQGTPTRGGSPRASARPGGGAPAYVISRAQTALTVSSWLAKPDSGVGDRSADAMRAYLNWLDTAVTAVVTVFAAADLPDVESEAWADTTPRGLERRLSEVTGVTGWQGVVESRNVLTGIVALSCGQVGSTVSRTDAGRFVRVVVRALDQWQQLVNEAGEVASGVQTPDGTGRERVDREAAGASPPMADGR